MTNAAFYFEDEAYSMSGAQLLGRQSAGHGFLTAFARHAEVDALWGYSPRQGSAESFEKFVRPLRPDRPVRALTAASLARLAEPGCLYFPGPDIAQIAWYRESHGSARWSLCGVNHTLATKRVMDGIVDLLVAPVEPWDAVVCTSAASHEVIERLFEAQGEWLARRLGAAKAPRPRLPVIPLGVDCDAYASSAADRARARQALGLAEGDIAVIFLGRLSFHAKAHPLAMYRALGAAAGGRSVVLIEAGWFANDRIAEAFAEARAAACPAVGHRLVDGRDPAARRDAWAAADVFCSLSDNIQETFGLAPIEAMAAGLPTVVTDWDGYRDTVRDNVDGFRIRTAMPVAGVGQALALRHALEVDDYDHYIGYLSQFAVVDLEATARAFEALFADAELRRQMGESGRKRAREVFDWRRVIAAYQALWGELAEERKRHAGAAARRWPARMDPFALFASFPSAGLGAESWIERAPLDPAELGRLRSLAMVTIAHAVLPGPEVIDRLLARVPAEGVVQLRGILATLPQNERPAAVRTLAWLAKLGALRVRP
jgi:glycosyltransferase involved in cell wall biosynthesis